MDQETYEHQLRSFIQVNSKERPEFENRYYRHAILNEDRPITLFDEHYVYHVAWAIRKVFERSPEIHLDFSSSLHFVTAVSSFAKTLFVDLRPPRISIEGLECRQADLTALAKDFGRYTSVSCMHVVEHIGLGRYGDSLDVNGDLKAVENLKRTVAPGGTLYFVVPVGQPSVSFNAHRVYDAETVYRWFSNDFLLNEFYFIPGNFKESPRRVTSLEDTRGYPYGCGCFEFYKC